MFEIFNDFRTRYVSKELSLETLKKMQDSLPISFENHGISRSNLDCLLCTIVLEPLKEMKHHLEQEEFHSPEAFKSYMDQALLLTPYDFEESPTFLSYASDCGLVDVFACVEANGRVVMDASDIVILDRFDVLLRVQH